MILALVLQGCTTCQVSVPDGNAADQPHALGIRYGSQIIKAIPEADQPNTAVLHDVEMRDNWFYDLVGVFTLGFAKPSEISYKHIKPLADTGGTISMPQPASVQPHSAGVGFGIRYITAVPETCQCVSPGLYEVEVKDNLFYDLVGVLSFGLAKPSEISYRNIQPLK
jgi:hypothetical protein